jgi:hypothetical protein
MVDSDDSAYHNQVVEHFRQVVTAAAEVSTA